jgi:hypothetical protein
MATSPYFNNYNSHSEQRVIEDLIVESIKIMGFDAYYLPNDNDASRDLLYGEDPLKKFTRAFPIELYLSSSMDYMGEKDFFSKFGLEIRNNVNVILSKRTFSQRLQENTFTRPREGDLVYVPVLNGVGELYEIKFANQNKDFNMLGRKVPYFYELEMEKFKFSQEVIDTGISNIDQVVTDSAYTLDLNMGTGTGSYGIGEIVFQSPDSTYANATSYATVQGWIPSTKVLSVINIYSEFTDGHVIIGQSTGAQFTLGSFDPLDTPVPKEKYDNKYIENSSNGVVDFSETNPFGQF